MKQYYENNADIGGYETTHGYPVLISNAARREYKRQLSNFDTAKKLYEKSLQHAKLNKEIISNRDNNKDFSNGWAAFREFFKPSNTETYTLGISGMLETMDLYKASRK